MNFNESLHRSFCEKSDKLSNWFRAQSEPLTLSVTSSYDIRDAGFKVANVDGNVYPAGFNNICPTDLEHAPIQFRKYLNRYFPKVKKIMLVTEEHTANAYYWNNVSTLKKLLEATGLEIRLAFPKSMEQPIVVQNALGESLEVGPAWQNHHWYTDFSPEILFSNNDFSKLSEEWISQVTVPIIPSYKLGWFQRKKGRYFHHYNSLAQQFCEVAGIDPFQMQVRTDEMKNFDVEDEASLMELGNKVDLMLNHVRSDYRARKIDQEPFVFVKNNSGTYGLAVVQVRSGHDIVDWGYKSRKKMKAAKGGREVTEVIIQEGIPSRVMKDGVTAEPVIYMSGCELVGGFLRTHPDKNAHESLNSPGAVFQKLCVSDLEVSLEGSPLENIYGWSARLGALAIANELQELTSR